MALPFRDVSPACAGMILDIVNVDWNALSEPRMRGDDPGQEYPRHGGRG